MGAGRAACGGALACVVGARGASAITGAAGALRSSDLPRASAGAAAVAAGGKRWVGGATFVSAITLTAGVAAAAFNSLRAPSSSGRPGFAVSCGCCAENPIRASGGAVRATTGLSNTRAGGLSPCAALPRTLFSVGARCGTTDIGALTIMSSDTRTADLDTGCDCTNVVAGTATTAPGTRWLA